MKPVLPWEEVLVIVLIAVLWLLAGIGAVQP